MDCRTGLPGFDRYVLLVDFAEQMFQSFARMIDDLVGRDESLNIKAIDEAIDGVVMI
jgi:hypothetical protein